MSLVKNIYMQYRHEPEEITITPWSQLLRGCHVKIDWRLESIPYDQNSDFLLGMYLSYYLLPWQMAMDSEVQVHV